MARLAEIWRHPIKAHGRERVEHATLAAGETLPWDRRWAVAHEASKANGETWVPCANFSRAAKAPGLMAITAASNPSANTVTLVHPDRPDLTFDPDSDVDSFLDWVRPLMPADRASSSRIVRSPGRGMTDSDFPSVSINAFASHGAVEGRIGRALSHARWRGNLWIDGTAPWEEFDWIGRQLQIGEVVLDIRQPITRCLATAANPETGQRDADILSELDGFGHRDFGVLGAVITGGTIRPGDTVTLL